jgi:tetratricopeptide (TPR) repeat protein
MRSAFRIVSLTVVTLCAALAVSAQDLGSANKLFGGSKPARPAVKKTTAKKKTAPASKPPVRVAATKKPADGTKAQAKRNVPAKTTAKKNAPASTEAKQPATKSHEITSPTGTKLSKPPADTTGTRTRFAEDRKPFPKPDEKKAAARLDDKKSALKVDKMSARPVETRISPADEGRFDELIEQGNSSRDNREYARAESIYKSAHAINPRDARAIYGLGNIYSDQQRWEEAENAYRTALQLEPSSALTHIALSYVLTQPLPVANLSDRYAEAEKLARRATELSPRNALALDQLGVAMEMRGEMGSETENAYRKALALDPSFAPAYAHLGRVLRRRGLTDQSKDAYAQATERSTDVGTTVLVAEVMQSEQHYGESIPLLRQALEADPRNPSALLMLGHALTIKGEYTEAESALHRALTVSSNGYQANVLLASLYMRQGAYELAENALLQAVRWAPAYENRQLAQQFVMLAQAYSKVGKSQQSQRAYAQAGRIDPDSGVVSGRFRQ